MSIDLSSSFIRQIIHSRNSIRSNHLWLNLLLIEGAWGS
jgi:hypothetical protein